MVESDDQTKTKKEKRWNRNRSTGIAGSDIILRQLCVHRAKVNGRLRRDGATERRSERARLNRRHRMKNNNCKLSVHGSQARNGHVESKWRDEDARAQPHIHITHTFCRINWLRDNTGQDPKQVASLPLNVPKFMQVKCDDFTASHIQFGFVFYVFHFSQLACRMPFGRVPPPFQWMCVSWIKFL